MKRLLIAIASITAIIIASCGKQVQDQKDATLELKRQQVLETEDAYVAAEVNRDEAALDRLVDDRFILNSENGTTSGKQHLIKAVLNMNMTDQIISDRSVIIEGNVGIIFGTTELEFQNPGEEPRLSKLRYTSVYVKRNEEWRMLALQMQPHSSQ
jgi:ketosteroid isomerase-like protein